MILVLEQLLNGLQYGVMLFLLAAGLTLIFGIMGVINLAHGSLYMVGAYAGTLVAAETGSFWLGLPAALGAAALTGLAIEALVIRRLYARDHLDQVLATFALILTFNQLIVLGFGRQPVFTTLPEAFSGSIEILPGLPYPTYRLLIIAVGLLVALGLYLLINRTRVGMLVRAGATHRDMVRALGVDIRMLYTSSSAWARSWRGWRAIWPGPSVRCRWGWASRSCSRPSSSSSWAAWGRSRAPSWAAFCWGSWTRCCAPSCPRPCARSCPPRTPTRWASGWHPWGSIC
jgi:hypothetical protein